MLSNDSSPGIRADRPHKTQQQFAAESQSILEILAAEQQSGQDFFVSLASQLVSILDVTFVLVTETLDEPATKVRTLAACSRDKVLDNFEIDLQGTPCQRTIRGHQTFHAHSVQELYPDCGILKQVNAESYCGIPIYDSQSKVTGHIVILDGKKMSPNPAEGPVLKTFAMRIAIELQRSRYDMQLRDKERQLREVMNTAIDAIVVVGQSGQIIEWNPSAEFLFGWSNEEAIGQPIFDVVMPARLRNEHVDGLSRLLTDGECPLVGKRLEVTGIRKDGTEFPSEMSMAPLQYRHGRAFAAFVRDLTSQRQAESQLKETQRRLAHVSRLNNLEEMVTGIAHELKQPLSAISNYAGALKATRDPTLIVEATEAIGQQAFRAGEIVRRFRDLASKSKNHRTRCNLNDLIAETVALVRYEVEQFQIRINVDYSSRLALVFVDEIQIQQVILNLLRNAIEAVVASGKTQKTITIQTLQSGDDVEFVLDDNGCGVTVRNVFEPFVTSKDDGMGIGLSISRTIIESHGGKIWLEDTLDSGETRFRFRVPSAEDDPAPDVDRDFGR